MALRRALSHDEVRRARDMHKGGHPITVVARALNVSYTCIERIVTGRTYRDVTEISHDPDACECVECVLERRRDENFRRGPLVVAVAVCVQCGRDFDTTATTLLARPRTMTCSECKGRNEK